MGTLCHMIIVRVFILCVDCRGIAMAHHNVKRSQRSKQSWLEYLPWILVKNSSPQDHGFHDLYWMGIELAFQCQCQTFKYGQEYRLLRTLDIGRKIFLARATWIPRRPLIGNELDAGFFTTGNTIGEWSIRHFIIAREWTIWHAILSSLSGKYWF